MTREELRVFLGEHFCGCGNPTGASATLLEMLEIWNDKDRAAYLEFPKLIQDDGAMFLLVYLIDQHMGLLEHGGGVLASWLTSKGEAVMEALRREKADAFEALHEMHCAHGFDVEGDNTHDCMAYEASQRQGKAEDKP